MHPERGMESVEIIVKLLAGHDLNHLAPLEQIRRVKRESLTMVRHGGRF